MSVTVKITSCLDCAKHGIERDPSSGDSFDWQDNALVCKAAKPPKGEVESRLLHDDPPGRIILGASRCAESEYKNKRGDKIPKWCPLRRRKR
jgi:hypothetical protein